MTVLKNVTKPETVQYVLALLIQLLRGGVAASPRWGCSYWPVERLRAGLQSIDGPAALERAENPSRARLFHQQSDQHLSAQPDPYTVFERWV